MKKNVAAPLVLLMSLAGCVAPDVPGVERLGDGVMRARTADDAEAFCRTSGDPTRVLDAPAKAQGVLFRCD